jgi:ribonuclease HI
MPIHIYTDASIANKEGRGAYVITKNSQNKGFKSSNAYTSIKMCRTPIVEIKNNRPTICDLEFKTLVGALIRAIKLHPKEVYFKAYTDSEPAILRMNTPWYEVQRTGMEDGIKKLHTFIAQSGRDIRIKMVHVKAHKDKLGTVPEKMNFVCDLMASVVNKV